ncbi:unnamed protein product [Penicillium roqueforti FM164]|uniref:Genomic scaffold, ProqFM164S02 n=1 Tax=Penicillium roqueforti (strain FM164) TaxID=1365484 RepID=W6Q7Z0_PENRF|nr:unnamed protein product [Penicillium roqueforti FM164]
MSEREMEKTSIPPTIDFGESFLRTTVPQNFTHASTCSVAESYSNLQDYRAVLWSMVCMVGGFARG